MNNRFKINEEEKSRIKELHSVSLFKEQWQKVDIEEESTDGLDKELEEQRVDRVDTLTHEDFMSKVDGYCIKLLGPDGKTGTEETEEDDHDKFVGIKSIKNWSDTEQWVRAYCKGK